MREHSFLDVLEATAEEEHPVWAGWWLEKRDQFLATLALLPRAVLMAKSVYPYRPAREQGVDLLDFAATHPFYFGDVAWCVAVYASLVASGDNGIKPEVRKALHPGFHLVMACNSDKSVRAFWRGTWRWVFAASDTAERQTLLNEIYELIDSRVLPDGAGGEMASAVAKTFRYLNESQRKEFFNFLAPRLSRYRQFPAVLDLWMDVTSLFPQYKPSRGVVW